MIYRVLGVGLRCWRLWHIIDGLRTLVLLSCYIRVACCGINGILSLCSFGVHFRLSRVLLFASQVRIILDGIFLSVSCLSHRILSVCLGCWRLWHCVDGLRAFILLSRHIRIRSRCINGTLSLCSFGVYLGLGCILLFASQVRVFLNRIFLSVGCLSHRILGVGLRCWCLWHRIDCLRAFVLLSCDICVACCGIDGILSLSCFGVYFRLSCILLFACQVRVFLNRVLLSVRCLSYRVFRISFRCRGLWHIIDGFGTFILLSCHIRIRSRCIDGILSLRSFGVYLGLSCILLFASQVRIFLNRVLLSVRCLSDCILGVCFSCWSLWHCVNRVLTSIFLSCYIRIACRCIDGILSLCSFGINFCLGCVFLFAS